MPPIPQDGGLGDDDDPLRSLMEDVLGAKGGTVLTETTAAGWGEGRAATPQSDWQPSRIGANPTPVLLTLRGDAYDAVLAACEVPPDLARVPTVRGSVWRSAGTSPPDSNLSPPRRRRTRRQAGHAGSPVRLHRHLRPRPHRTRHLLRDAGPRQHGREQGAGRLRAHGGRRRVTL